MYRAADKYQIDGLPLALQNALFEVRPFLIALGAMVGGKMFQPLTAKAVIDRVAAATLSRSLSRAAPKAGRMRLLHRREHGRRECHPGRQPCSPAASRLYSEALN